MLSYFLPVYFSKILSFAHCNQQPVNSNQQPVTSNQQQKHEENIYNQSQPLSV